MKMLHIIIKNFSKELDLIFVIFLMFLCILFVLSVFTISLAMGAYVRRSRISEEDRFVVEFGCYSKGIKGSVNQLK